MFDVFIRGSVGVTLAAVVSTGCSGAEPSPEASVLPLPVFPSLSPGAVPGDVPPSNTGGSGSSAPPGLGAAGSADPASEDTAAGISDLVPGAAGTSASNDGAEEPVPPEDGEEPVGGGPTLSPGCAQGAPGPEGQLSIQVGGANAAYTVALPDGYQPGVPMPLVFGFHGRNRTHLEFEQVDASQIQTELGSRAVMVYLKSQAGPGWNFAAEVEPNVAFFEALYPAMLANYCVDTSRVFAVGHSSGGYFSNILACRFGERLRGIASIAGASQETSCNAGPVAALIIHGVRDEVVNFTGGQGSRDFHRAANGCSGEALPTAVAPCIAYQGCAPGLPVEWCEHAEPTYEDTNHGWPSFASRAAGQFLFALPRR
jgi:polyhydroxybutyrate depolymerase